MLIYITCSSFCSPLLYFHSLFFLFLLAFLTVSSSFSPLLLLPCSFLYSLAISFVLPAALLFLLISISSLLLQPFLLRLLLCLIVLSFFWSYSFSLWTLFFPMYLLLFTIIFPPLITIIFIFPIIVACLSLLLIAFRTLIFSFASSILYASISPLLVYFRYFDSFSSSFLSCLLSISFLRCFCFFPLLTSIFHLSLFLFPCRDLHLLSVYIFSLSIFSHISIALFFPLFIVLAVYLSVFLALPFSVPYLCSLPSFSLSLSLLPIVIPHLARCFYSSSFSFLSLFPLLYLHFFRLSVFSSSFSFSSTYHSLSLLLSLVLFFL